MRSAPQNRFFSAGLVLAALLLVIYSVPWTHESFEAALRLCPSAHITVEASLNLLWMTFAACVFIHWGLRGIRRPRAGAWELVSVAFVLVLLFPIISASDDFAQFELIDDNSGTQLSTLKVQNDKHVTVPAEGAALTVRPVQSDSAHSSPSEVITEPTKPASVTKLGGTTGNHSPPVC